MNIHQRGRIGLTGLLSAFLLAGCSGGRPDLSATTRASEGANLTIIRTEHAIPHIVADDYYGAGFGTAFAQAEDNFCLLAAMWASYAGEAARYSGRNLGPGQADRDLYNAYLNATVDYDALLNSKDPIHGPSEDVLAILDGFVAGYNAYYQKAKASGELDPECRDGAHLREITRTDIARRLYQLIGKGGRDLVWAGQVNAFPPGLSSAPTLPAEAPLVGSTPATPIIQELNQVLSQVPGTQTPADPLKLYELGVAFSESIAKGGSNAVGLGGAATDNGAGLLLANPHWTWDGFDRFWQMHVNIRDELNVAGMGFIGQPLVMIGHNEHVAWTHTVSAGRRLAIVELALVPGNPTQYIVDGEVLEMEPVTVTIQVRNDAGELEDRSHTFYNTIYGPVTTSILGIDLLPWTLATAYAMIDMNTGSTRIANQFVETHKAKSAAEHYAVHAKYVGNPWATTTVVDDQGAVHFTDVGTIPNISNEHAARCNVALGHALWNTFGVAVLRGSDSSCDVPTATGSDDPHQNSMSPKTMPAADQPYLLRDDYMVNSNESHWLTNAYEPMVGYSRVFGPEGTQRGMRTRLGHMMFQGRLEGTDGSGKTTFSRQDLQDTLFSNRNYLGETWADDLADICEQYGTLPTLDGEVVDVSEACPILRAWNRTNNLDNPGGVLWTRFAQLSYAQTDFLTTYIGIPALPMWKVPFLPTDPVGTPNGLNPAFLPAHAALAGAVRDLRNGGIPLDAAYRTHQISRYGSATVPLHGSHGELGSFNHMHNDWDETQLTAGGPPGGPSFLMVTQFEPDAACTADTRTLLLGGQRSEHAWDRADEQQIKYSNNIWVDPPFCDHELEAAAKESVTRIENGVIVQQ